jgi:hypothetical protein
MAGEHTSVGALVARRRNGRIAAETDFGASNLLWLDGSPAP